MGTIPPLHLTRKQVGCFYEALYSYWGVILKREKSSAERTQTLRMLERMQDKVREIIVLHTNPLRLALTVEEMALAKTLTDELLTLYAEHSAEQPDDPDSREILGDLTDLKGCLSRDA